MKTTPYTNLEKRIAKDEHGGVLHRHRYGRQVLEAKSGRERLPKGMLDDLIKAALRAGLSLSKREIQYRIKLAETYETEAHTRKALASIGGWFDLISAGFPPVELDDEDLEQLDAEGLTGAPDSWEQMQFEIPGLKDHIKVSGRTIPLVRGDDGAKVSDIAAYLDMCEQKHENFGKTVDRIRESLQTMRAGAGGDDEANAVEAWEAGSDDDEDPDTA